MPIDLAAIFIGVLAIVVSVIAGVYAASAISSEYVAQITARLIVLEQKMDKIVDQQTKVMELRDKTILEPSSPPLLEQSSPEIWPTPVSDE